MYTHTYGKPMLRVFFQEREYKIGHYSCCVQRNLQMGGWMDAQRTKHMLTEGRGGRDEGFGVVSFHRMLKIVNARYTGICYKV